nr:hypothetical protein [Tanacetum cinerariifolium]
MDTVISSKTGLHVLRLFDEVKHVIDLDLIQRYNMSFIGQTLLQVRNMEGHESCSSSHELSVVKRRKLSPSSSASLYYLIHYAMRHSKPRSFSFPRVMLKLVHYKVSTLKVERIYLLSLPIGILHFSDGVWLEASLP